MLNLLLLRLPQLTLECPLTILELADDLLELLLRLLMRPGLASQLVLVLLGLRLQRLDLLALRGGPLLQLHHPLVERPHGIVLRLQQESLRVHELSVRCLLMQKVVVPLQKFVILGDRLVQEQFLPVQDRGRSGGGPRVGYRLLGGCGIK